MKNKKTKIICTLGPGTCEYRNINQLYEAGMNAVRLNCSHGSHDFLEKIIRNVSRINSEKKSFIPIIADLQGPKIRLGIIPDIILKKNQVLYFNTKNIYSHEPLNIPIAYERFCTDIKIGENFFINDGLIKCIVTEKAKNTITAKVIAGGKISSHKGINLPDTKLKISSLTEKDINDLHFLKNFDISYIALSFVRDKKDIIKLKEIIEQTGFKNSVSIIAKIEKPQAVENIDEILDECDGIMIARGDLGIETPIQKIPFIQKQLLEKANIRGKLVITATQMLESMIQNRIPTRAEVTDVANAVYDGTDAVMLSGETAVGIYPVETVQIMTEIIRDAELRITNKFNITPLIKTSMQNANTVIHSACSAAADINAGCIAVLSASGKSVLLTSNYKPMSTRIAGITMNESTAKKMNLYWGVTPILCDKIFSIETIFDEINTLLLKNKIIRKGDTVIITAGFPLSGESETNLMKLHKVV